MTIISDPRLRLCITTDPIRSNPKTSDHIKYNLWCILSFSLQVFSLQIGYTPIIINYQYQLTILNNVKSRDPIGSKNYWLNLIYQNTKNIYLTYFETRQKALYTGSFSKDDFSQGAVNEVFLGLFH